MTEVTTLPETINFYDVMLLVTAGASFCIAFLAMTIGVMTGDTKKWVLLALLGAFEGLYCTFLYYYFASPTKESSLFWIGTICMFMPFLTYIYVALAKHVLQTVPRWFEPFPAIALAVSVVFAGLMGADLFLGTHFVFSDLLLHPGTLHRKLMLFNVFGQGYFTFVNALFYTSAFLLFCGYRRGRKNLLPILLGTGGYFIALSSDFNILFEFYDFYFIQHYGFLAMIFGFNLHYSQDYISSARNLAAAHTELKQHRERMIQDEKLRLMGEISSFISHEINSPLMVIQAVSQITLKKLEDQVVVSTNLKKIDNAVDRISKITKGMSSFARDDSFVVAEITNLKKMIGEAIEFSRYRGSTAVIAIEALIDENIELECYPTQIVQCVLNILHNSIDAQQSNEKPWIKITAQEAADTIAILITDSGPTITPEVSLKIMQPFYTTKARGNGTGIGLSISQMILARHGGIIEIDSDAANACFRIVMKKKTGATNTRNKVI